MNVIEIKNLHKTFHEKEALHHLSLTVRHGYIYGFPGPNGSGKITILSILPGLMDKDSGKVRVMGQDVESQDKENDNLEKIYLRNTGGAS